MPILPQSGDKSLLHRSIRWELKGHSASARTGRGRRRIRRKGSKAEIFIAAPDGEAGGGMGRVKDYMLACPSDRHCRYKLVPLVTRDGRGVGFSILLLLSAMWRIAAGIIRGRAAMLHVHMGDRGSIARKGLLLCFARLCGIPALLHLHAVELEGLYAEGSRTRRRFIRLPFQAATAIIALGTRPKAFLVETMGIDPDKIDVLINGVPSVAIPPDRSARGGKPCRILFLGNLIERKGVADLLRALAQLGLAAGTWEATLAGGGNEDFYRSLATKLGIAPQIRFAGWIGSAEVHEQLVWADILVLPSYDEGLPLVILEALGFALPVICTPVGAIPEVLLDEKTALMIAPGDVSGLARAIGRLVTQPALRSRLGDEGRRLYEERLSLRAFQDGFLSIYRARCGIDYAPDRSGEPPCD